MIRQLDRLAAVVVLTAGLGREHRRQHVRRAHAQDRRRRPAPALKPQHRQRARHVPAPARLPHRRLKRRLDQRLVDRVLVQELEDRQQRERVLRPERQQDRVVRRRGLQLEVEATTKLLAQAHAESAVDPGPEGRVNDQLHAAGLVEEALGHQPRPGRHHTQRLHALLDVRVRLGRADRAQAALGLQQLPRALGVTAADVPGEQLAQVGHLRRQLGRAREPLAEPKRDVGRLPLRIGDTHPALLDAEHPPRVRPELEHVADHAVDREVLVDRADHRLARVLDHRVVGLVGDRPARGQRGQLRPAPPADGPVDPVEMQERSGPPAAGRDAVAEHVDHRVEVSPLQAAIRPRAADHRPQRLDLPLVGRAGRHQLLREDVERRLAVHRPIDAARHHRPNPRGALDQLVARHREDAPPGRATDRVTGPPDALAQHGDRSRRAELDHQLDVPDVDAELERGRGHHRPDRARLQPLLDRQARPFRQRPVVRRDRALAEPLLEVVGDPLRHAPARHEDQRGPVLAQEHLDARVDIFPRGPRGHRRQRLLRNLDAHVERRPPPGVDQHAGPRRELRRARAGLDERQVVSDQEARRLGGRLDGRRQPDPLQPAPAQRVEALERERQVSPALVADQRVDLVDDDLLAAGEDRPPARRGQQQVQRLRRRDQQVGRVADDAGAVGRRRVAGAQRRADRRHRDPELRRRLLDPPQRRLQVAIDVRPERLERRDVDDLHPLAGRPPPHQRVDAGQKRRQRLARARRRHDEGVVTAGDRRPAPALRLRRRREATREPALDRRAEAVRGRHRPRP